MPPELLKKNGKLGRDCFNKGTQKGGPFDGDLFRVDAGMMSLDRASIPEIDIKPEKRKVRGRKNRYVHQIDHEDHEAGAALDSDEEGEIANERAKRDHIERMAQLEAIREEDEELEIKRKEREKRRELNKIKEKKLA